jgi:hypothetical protein
MAGSEQKSGFVERARGRLQARKQRSAERARRAGELKRDRRTLDKKAGGLKGGSSGGV